MSLYNVIDTPSCIRAVPTCVSSIIIHSPARAAAVDVQATDANIVVQIVQPVHHRQGGVAAAVAGVKRLRHLDIATGLGLVARVPEHQSP